MDYNIEYLLNENEKQSNVQRCLGNSKYHWVNEISEITT